MNQLQKEIMGLQKKARDRRETRSFVIEGVRLFSEAPAGKILKIIVSESFLKQKQAQKLLEGRRYETVSDPVFEMLSDTKTPQGIMAVIRQYEYSLTDLIPQGKPPLILILETIQDPGNLGTMFRAAEAAGVTGILTDRNTADPYNPKTVRSTMGSIFRMPFVITDDLTASVTELKQRGIRIFAAHLEGSVSYDLQDYREGSAFMIGNEANGLKKETASLADSMIRIPMQGSVESLNAAMAATVLLFEASRQRRIQGSAD